MIKELDSNALNEAGWEFIYKWNTVMCGEAMSARQFDNIKPLLRYAILKYLDEAEK